jgi:hypothetical protein
MPTTPQNPTDATTLGEALASFEREGFTGQFVPREGTSLMCTACREESPAGSVEMEALIRTEGASDPDDMTAVAALTCPRCSARGTVTLHFGAEATVEESEILSALEDRRTGTGTTP